MADYLKSNREEIERFLRKSDDAFAWDHYFEFVASLENQTSKTVEERTRKAIRCAPDNSIFQFKYIL
jgi:hypothetical protein